MQQRHDLVAPERRQCLQQQVLVFQQRSDHRRQRATRPHRRHEEDPPIDRERHQNGERHLVQLVDVIDDEQRAALPCFDGELSACPVEQRRPVVVADADSGGQVGRQQVGHGAEWNRLRRRVADHLCRRAVACRREQLGSKPRLAHSGRAGEDDAARFRVRVQAAEAFEEDPSRGQRPSKRHVTSVAPSIRHSDTRDAKWVSVGRSFGTRYRCRSGNPTRQ